MVNATHDPATRAKSPLAAGSASARTDLVNFGQDTRITLGDGSTIVLKGVTQPEAVFSCQSAAQRS